ncbi:nucleoside hydrolase [Vulcanococcus sp. Clear-D1]|uniref:nucleoside hydrolase n=1 Tax=Vulcanococcus sp. Clear-D1 TaxID=2766970 RepID=UPI00199D8160|nr:nucleoside hydrolase [Vulcanococcus sp. Clear-D1]MBD1195482.1 nucleoside hydrolase [Vulcanococcus sp. Clear-D1]
MDWIIDTDMGLDDRIALLYLAQISKHPESKFNIKAILTQGTGLTHSLPAKNNAVRLLRYAGIPTDQLPIIGQGGKNTLEGFHQYPSEWRYTEDNLRGFKIPGYPKAAKQQNGKSVDILREVLVKSQSKISILELGTFTTLAKVLAKSPKLAGKIDHIVSMGGSVDVKGNIHNTPNERAEFNFWIDPVAAKTVFDLGIPITIVPLDATNQAPLTEDFLANFQKNAVGRVANLAATWWEDVTVNPLGEEYYHWDPLAAAIAVTPDLITNSQEVKIKVNAKVRDDISPEEGSPFGDPSDFSLLNWKGRPRSPLDPFKSGWTKRDSAGQDVKVVFQADVSRFESFLTSVLDEDFDKTDGLHTLFSQPVSEI